jgi:hypothetical protein
MASTPTPQPIPDGYRRITPALVVDGATKALECGPADLVRAVKPSMPPCQKSRRSYQRASHGTGPRRRPRCCAAPNYSALLDIPPSRPRAAATPSR